MGNFCSVHSFIFVISHNLMAPYDNSHIAPFSAQDNFCGGHFRKHRKTLAEATSGGTLSSNTGVVIKYSFILTQPTGHFIRYSQLYWVEATFASKSVSRSTSSKFKSEKTFKYSFVLRCYFSICGLPVSFKSNHSLLTSLINKVFLLQKCY